MQPHSNPT